MAQSSNSNGIWEWDIVKYVSLGSMLLFGVLLLMYGYTEEGVRQNIRWSAKISFVLFVLAFGAAGLHFYFKNSFTWWLRMNRKFLGISFAIIHLIHLGFILFLQLSFHPVFIEAGIVSLIGGGLAYFFVVVMLLTSFESLSKFVPKILWKQLHTIGGYWITIVFFSQYLEKTDEPWYWLFILALVLMLLLRLNQLRPRKTKA